jgi:hypothetical protein
MADPIAIALAGAKVMVKRHQLMRRNTRLSNARLVVTQLADEGCHLGHFQHICKRKHAWFDTPGGEQEVLGFLHGLQIISNDPTLVENAKSLIGLYGWSQTTRSFVDGAAKLGTYKYLRKENKLAAYKDRIVVLVEAGFDLAVLQQIAVDAAADGHWMEADVWDAVNTLYANDTAKDALIGRAVELVVFFVEDPDASELVNEVLGLGIEDFYELAGIAGELVADF